MTRCTLWATDDGAVSSRGAAVYWRLLYDSCWAPEGHDVHVGWRQRRATTAPTTRVTLYNMQCRYSGLSGIAYDNCRISAKNNRKKIADENFTDETRLVVPNATIQQQLQCSSQDSIVVGSLLLVRLRQANARNDVLYRHYRSHISVIL